MTSEGNTDPYQTGEEDNGGWHDDPLANQNAFTVVAM